MLRQDRAGKLHSSCGKHMAAGNLRRVNSLNNGTISKLFRDQNEPLFDSWPNGQAVTDVIKPLKVVFFDPLA